ncbi:MAG TPA: DUF2760 domain-containing protein [Planctomycetota bacterium]|nr:DUF2760 domain-containing protein [Planctomycetota bacterium]
MGLGLAFRCFFAGLGSDERAARLERVLDGIPEQPQIREVIREREVAVPMRDAPPPREIIKEVPVEVIKEVIKEVPVEVIKEVIKEVPVEVVKEVPIDREVIKEVVKEVPVDREVLKEVPVEVVKEVIKEVPVEVIKEVVKEVPVVKEVEVIKEVVKEVPKEIVKETIREVPIETIKEVVKLVPDTHGPVQLLALLQQDGRLVDFLQENIDSFEDDQIGAAVREIHAKCRKALAKYCTLEPVRTEKEGETVSLGGGFDPSAIRVTGRVTEKAPMFGTLRHRGWKAVKVELPQRPSGADPTIVMAAEVEVE